MYQIIKKSHLKCIESNYQKKCEETALLKNELKKQQELLTNLTRKLVETGAFIFSIRPNKNGEPTYICIIDHRDSLLNGSLDMFAINSEIHPRKEIGKYTDMPYLQAFFSINSITLQELHSDIIGDLYEGCGYATMMVDALKQIAQDSNRFIISGTLSERDAQTEEKKNKRNSFYNDYGFSMEFDDKTCKSGRFKLFLQ